MGNQNLYESCYTTKAPTAPTPPTLSPTYSPTPDFGCETGEFWNKFDEECDQCPTEWGVENCEGLNKNQCRNQNPGKENCIWCGKLDACFAGQNKAVCEVEDLYEPCFKTKAPTAPTPPTLEPTYSPTPDFGCEDGEYWNRFDEKCDECPTEWGDENCASLNKNQCRNQNPGKKNCIWCGKLDACFAGQNKAVCEVEDLYESCYKTKAPTTAAPTPLVQTSTPTAAPTNNDDCEYGQYLEKGKGKCKDCPTDWAYENCESLTKNQCKNQNPGK